MLRSKGGKQLQIMFTMIDTRDVNKTARVLTIEQTGIFKVVITSEDPNQQLLDTCLLLDTLPSANAVADEGLMIKEFLTVIAKRGGAVPQELRPEQENPVPHSHQWGGVYSGRVTMGRGNHVP